jgi:hypothetical protein
VTVSVLRTSSRLLRAAAAERADLERQRERLTARREELRGELERIEEGLFEVDDRMALLDRLAGSEIERARAAAGGRDEAAGFPPGSVGVHEVGSRRERARAPAPAAAPPLPAPPAALRGTAIRETAVRVLLERSGGGGPVHYREWFDLLASSGHEVAGRDPLAAFLTQISRSPVVRRTTRAGVYEIDVCAPDRLRRRLAALQEELRRVADPAARIHGPDSRRRARELMGAMGRLERSLEEAVRSLDALGGEGGARALAIAAGS